MDEAGNIRVAFSSLGTTTFAYTVSYQHNGVTVVLGSANVTAKIDYTGNFVVDNAEDTIDYNFTEGNLTLREALFIAANYKADTTGIAITFAGDISTIVMAGAQNYNYFVSKNVASISGTSGQRVKIDANNESPISWSLQTTTGKTSILNPATV